MISSMNFVPLGALRAKLAHQDVTHDDLKVLKGRLEETMHQPESTSEDADFIDDDMEAEFPDRAVALQKAKDAAKRSITGDETDPVSKEMIKELKLDEYDSQEELDRTSFLDNLVSSVPDEYARSKENRSDEDSLEEVEDSDEDSLEIENTDIVFLATKADDILSSIEILQNVLKVWLYEEADDNQGGNLLVHHDIPLACYPLCCEYIDVQPGETKEHNLVVVGGMEIGLEIYDLDVLNPISPVATLSLPSSKKKKKASTFSLSSNEKFRNVLASGCDDKRLRIWDLSQGEMTSEFKFHKDSVQSVCWNPEEASILLSGGHDKRLSLVDIRVPDGESLKWKLKAENEDLAWCGHQPTSFLASDESGEVVMFDARKGSQSEAEFTLKAHKENTTVLSVSPLNHSLFLTGSEDGKIKIWDLSHSQPQLIEKKHLGVGEVLAGGFCKYAGHLVMVGGEKGDVRVWDTRASSLVRNYYSTQDLKIPKFLL